MSTIVSTLEASPNAGQKASYLDLLDAVDQRGIRADLSLFFGPRADAFLETYEKMRAASSTQRRRMPRTWCWPVFVGSFTWFFYRKMYAFGAMIILLPIIFAYLFGSVGSSMFFLFAVQAKGAYVKMGLERILKADRLGLSGAERSEYLRRAGGVSLTAGIFAGFIYACILTVVVLAILARHHTHHA